MVCCDNLADNGAVLAALVAATLDAVPHGDRLREWVDGSVRFPGTMVDRIVPATTDAHRAEAQSLLGLSDAGLVIGEPFTQWVIQDTFAGPRPAWERVGATLTDDVAPYERAKLRVLNASHSTLAYLGALRGHATIAQAVADPALEATARALVDEDVLPTLVAPDGLDLAQYRDDVLSRFANPNTGHTTVQVAMDGSQKLPQRLLGTVRDRLDSGAVPTAAAASRRRLDRLRAGDLAGRAGGRRPAGRARRPAGADPRRGRRRAARLAGRPDARRAGRVR